MNAFSQTVFWTENFNNGCGSGCLAGGYSGVNGSWSTVDGGSQAFPNLWYVSCAEDGHLAGECGSACSSVNGASLHVGANDGLVTDPGAAYDAGGAFSCSFLGICTASNQRAISPLISTLGKSTITLSFDYIQYAQAGIDYCRLYYSTNSGTSWTLISSLPQTGCCGGPCNGSLQGLWTNYSTVLPAACDNIATLKFSLLWVNNNDGTGTDPSFASDNIKLSYLNLLPVEFLSFSANKKNKTVDLNWSTASETNNDYFTVERSGDGVHYSQLDKVAGSGNTTQLQSYSFTDMNPLQGVSYYRLKQTDFDGKFNYSKVVAVNFTNDVDFGVKNFYYSSDNHTIVMSLVSSDTTPFTVELTDVTGRVLSSHQFSLSSLQNDLIIPLPDIPSGMYLLKLNNGFVNKAHKIIF